MFYYRPRRALVLGLAFVAALCLGLVAAFIGGYLYRGAKIDEDYLSLIQSQSTYEETIAESERRQASIQTQLTQATNRVRELEAESDEIIIPPPPPAPPPEPPERILGGAFTEGWMTYASEWKDRATALERQNGVLRNINEELHRMNSLHVEALSEATHRAELAETRAQEWQDAARPSRNPVSFGPAMGINFRGERWVGLAVIIDLRRVKDLL